jgi:hypothetical protein
MRQWGHDGAFSLDAAIRIEARDRKGIERLLHYCARPIFASESQDQVGRAQYPRSRGALTAAASSWPSVVASGNSHLQLGHRAAQPSERHGGRWPIQGAPRRGSNGVHRLACGGARRLGDGHHRRLDLTSPQRRGDPVEAPVLSLAGATVLEPHCVSPRGGLAFHRAVLPFYADRGGRWRRRLSKGAGRGPPARNTSPDRDLEATLMGASAATARGPRR